jgi:hypothetical protein
MYRWRRATRRNNGELPWRESDPFGGSTGAPLGAG